MEAHANPPIRIETLPGAAPDDRDRHVVALPMTAHDRRRVRRRITAPDGTVLELALPTGTVLHVGQLLHASPACAYVVAAADEDVLVVRPRDVAEAARVGHLIGNLHRDLDVEADGTLVALSDAPLEARLRAAGLRVTAERRPFRGRAPGEHAH